jgi:flagellar basal body-associated protein FliL
MDSVNIYVLQEEDSVDGNAGRPKKKCLLTALILGILLFAAAGLIIAFA